MLIFSYNLTQLRKWKAQDLGRKLTAEECALAIGVKTKTYEAWEQGIAYPRMKWIKRICEYFDYYDVYHMLSFRLTSPPFKLKT